MKPSMQRFKSKLGNPLISLVIKLVVATIFNSVTVMQQYAVDLAGFCSKPATGDLKIKSSCIGENQQ